MKRICAADDIKQLGTILSVWAHPDDETYSCGGIMAAAIDNGQAVACLTATKGEAGVQDESRWPAAKLAEIRADEMEQALQHIGCTHHHWLGYVDGGCRDVPEGQAVEAIKAYIERYQPDTILTFGPDGMTGHPDHCTVSQWVKLATEGTAIQVFHRVDDPDMYEKHIKQADELFNIYFNIDKPTLVPAGQCAIAFELPQNIIDRKLAALKAMPSQTEAVLTHIPPECLEAFYTEFFVRAA